LCLFKYNAKILYLGYRFWKVGFIHKMRFGFDLFDSENNEIPSPSSIENRLQKWLPIVIANHLAKVTFRAIFRHDKDQNERSENPKRPDIG
jgi:hypothetical protein